MALIFISLFLAIVIFLLTVKLKEYVEEVAQLRKQIEETAAFHIIEKAKVKKDSTFRSSAVNWGKTIEHFVPFMSADTAETKLCLHIWSSCLPPVAD